VHTALRRGTHALAVAAAGLDPADDRRVRAFARYWKGFAGEVLAHHTIEDDICFPALVERVPPAAELIGRTDADHHRLDELMTAVGAGVADLAARRPAPTVAADLAELDDLMERHLDFEDADILPLFERHFSAEEYEELDARAAKALGITKQAAFTVPFVAAMIDAEDFERVFGDAPFAFRVLHVLTRGRYARLADRALGPVRVTTDRPVLRTGGR
jgi:hemerythrin-like domain-containing protein